MKWFEDLERHIKIGYETDNNQIKIVSNDNNKSANFLKILIKPCRINRELLTVEQLIRSYIKHGYSCVLHIFPYYIVSKLSSSIKYFIDDIINSIEEQDGLKSANEINNFSISLFRYCDEQQQTKIQKLLTKRDLSFMVLSNLRNIKINKEILSIFFNEFPDEKLNSFFYSKINEIILVQNFSFEQMTTIPVLCRSIKRVRQDILETLYTKEQCKTLKLLSNI